jgi:hypothetical protein
MAIYYLDVDDEITSAAARIRESSDTRIALVLTGGARVATSRINFRLLAGEAKRRHKRLAIVTADSTSQSVARSAGLPVFGTVGEYERAEATRAARRPGESEDDVSEALDELAATVVVHPGGKSGRAVAGGAGSGRNPGGIGFASDGRMPWRLTAALGFVTAAALASGLFFFYPSATVTLTVHEEQVGPVTFSATVDPNAIAADDQAGVIPGLKKAFPVSTSGTFDATGQKVTETPATGAVTFISKNTVNAVPIVVGTTVSTAGGVAFVTSRSVTVPAANFDTGTTGKVDAPIQAVNAGLSGNVAAGTIVKVPSDLLPFKISVTNAQPTTGGTHTVTPVIQQSDIDAAETAIMATLRSDFNDAVTAPEAAPSGATLFAITARLGISIFSPDPQAMVGQESASFQLDASATGTAVVADMTAVGGLAQSRVGRAVDGGFTLVQGSVATVVGAPVLAGETVQVPVTATARQARKLDETALRAAIKGKSVEDAKAYLAQFGVVQISVSPGWASSLPSFDFRIDFQLVEVAASPGGSPSASPSPEASAAPSTPAPKRTTTPGRTSVPSVGSSATADVTAVPTEPPASTVSVGPTG